MDRAILCLFAKPPVVGHVKTRLSSAIGAEAATLCAEAFLRDSVESLRRVSWARLVIAATEQFARSYFSDDELWLQPRGDLGFRLEQILRRALTDSGAAFAIGADSPGVPPRYLESARESLLSHDAVLGPCSDGGFYVLGLKTCPDGLLSGIRWSHPRTLDDTIWRLNRYGMTVARIESWFDVDTCEDLIRLYRMFETGTISARHTYEALQTLSCKRMPRPQEML